MLIADFLTIIFSEKNISVIMNCREIEKLNLSSNIFVWLIFIIKIKVI